MDVLTTIKTLNKDHSISLPAATVLLPAEKFEPQNAIDEDTELIMGKLAVFHPDTMNQIENEMTVKVDEEEQPTDKPTDELDG